MSPSHWFTIVKYAGRTVSPFQPVSASILTTQYSGNHWFTIVKYAGRTVSPFQPVCQHNHDTVLRQPVKQPSVAVDGSGLPVAEEVLAVTEIPGGTGGD